MAKTQKQEPKTKTDTKRESKSWIRYVVIPIVGSGVLVAIIASTNTSPATPPEPAGTPSPDSVSSSDATPGLPPQPTAEPQTPGTAISEESPGVEPSTREVVAVLKLRAARILKEFDFEKNLVLSRAAAATDPREQSFVETALPELDANKRLFEELHAAHIAAIEGGQMAAAHEIVIDIHYCLAMRWSIVARGLPFGVKRAFSLESGKSFSLDFSPKEHAERYPHTETTPQSETAESDTERRTRLSTRQTLLR